MIVRESQDDDDLPEINLFENVQINSKRNSIDDQSALPDHILNQKDAFVHQIQNNHDENERKSFMSGPQGDVSKIEQRKTIGANVSEGDAAGDASMINHLQEKPVAHEEEKKETIETGRFEEQALDAKKLTKA